MAGRNGNGKNGRDERGEWSEEPTKPGVPPPGLTQESNDSGDVPTIDETHRIADSLDNLALALRQDCLGLHEIAMALRRVADGNPINLRGRAAIGNALRGICVQVETTADVVHPEGKRAAEGGE